MSPFIIAEIGSNWITLEDCLYSVRKAKWAGANAVKFQLFTHRSLFGMDEAVASQHPNPYLPPSWLDAIYEHCCLHDIEFMCSAFSPEEASKVDPFVFRHKVASSEMNHLRLLERLNGLGKPVILSTASSTIPEIKRSLEVLKDVEVTVMYCVGSYPAKDIDLRNIMQLRKAFNYETIVGYSDHSTDIRIIPVSAFRSGASVIEKHMTAIEAKTPDSPHSLTAEEFKIMVQTIRGDVSEPYIGPQRDEIGMVLRHKRRLKAIQPINAGDKFIENVNFGIFRSLYDDTKALGPFDIGRVNNSCSTRNILIGDGIGPEDFK